MIRNYFKIALRNLSKNKGFSFINIFGLAVGITCASMIFLWVEDEIRFDDYFANKDSLYKVKTFLPNDSGTKTYDATPGLLAASMQTDIPGVVNTARSSVSNQELFSVNEKNFYVKGNFVDPSFLDMFQLNFLEGSASSAFNQLNSVVLTQKLAYKIFGSTKNIIGKTIQVDTDRQYVVQGIIEDLPDNTSFDFEWVAPFKLYENDNEWLKYWASLGVNTFVQIKANTDVSVINKKLYDYISTKQDGAIAKIELYPMTRWRLYDTFENGKEIPGRIKYVKLFSLIAWIILIIACINFMNLSTARSQKRAGEVGVRKVLGAGKSGLIFQFIGESLITALLSALLAVGLLFLLLPFFNLLIEKELSVNIFDPLHLGILLGITLLCGLISGIFPAFYLSSFKPVKVLKGLKIKEGSAVWVRKGLVVAQFSISVILIISTILIYQQIQHVKDRNLGFDKQHLVYIDVNENIQKNVEPIKNSLLQSGFVENVSLSTNTPLFKGSTTSNFNWQGKDPEKQVLITFEGVSPDYIKSMGIKLKEGRDFYPNIETDSSSILINKSFAKLTGLNDVVGSTIQFQDQPLTVIGVVDDFVYNNLYEKSTPLMFYASEYGNYLNIRFKRNADLSKALPALKNIMEENNPSYPFEYKFVDEQFEKSFKTETLIGELAGIFAAIAILISCLGLFGLAAYTAEQRKKEIGVRKVLGASVRNLVGLLSKDFLKLVVISCIISFPLAWWIMKDWLQDYEYRIDIGWWVFAVAGILAVLIALITVSFQAIKAAIANPVKSLRTE
ncbi:ABC transporter permease [Aequorivita lipolytica]|uniref:FtsX-like permease family protein n=1 Tax=Aequorivita lipolytica TaxID=153267 RepID=A0A5C6YNH5_9FLAO|nr:ABC transporter permease [Aequorivita lipolytica]TXD68961.1 FtsX-like permease family protein [Aequorivita lipolytica]SRX53058.1 Macrolide export ATP-binding/permease protein MacB [Aequorivita lipolytica]